MSTYSYTVVRDVDGDRNLTVFIPGRTTPPIREDHPNWDAIFNHVVVTNDPDVDSLVELLDIAAAVANKFVNLSETVSVKDGRVYVDRDPIENKLTAQILRFLKEDREDWLPLVRFFEKCSSNPNPHSREQMGDWLADHGFPITADGDIVGYKGVRAGNKEGVQFRSTTAGPAIVDGEQHEGGYVPNNIGSVIEVPRSYVQANPAVGCSTGLHIGTYSFAQSYGTVLEVHVNPRDVVSVPTECSAQKMRCCRYVVVGTVDAKIEEAVIPLEDENGPLNPTPEPESYYDENDVEYDDGENIEPDYEEPEDDYEPTDDEDDGEDDEAGQFQTDEGDERDAEEEGQDEPEIEATPVKHPSKAAFAKMQGRAKVRRQNIVKYATKMGPWTYLGGDPKDRKSWSV